MRQHLSLILLFSLLFFSACMGGFEAGTSVDQLEQLSQGQPNLEAGGDAELKATRDMSANNERPDEVRTFGSERSPQEMGGAPEDDERFSDRRSDESADAPSESEDPEPRPDKEQDCQELNSESAFGCYATSECCEGFCTYCGSSYMPGHCQLPLELGQACLSAQWCQSGVCVDGLCQAEACSGTHTECWASTDCCEGLFCAESGGYVPGTCTKPLSDGEACFYHDWCASKTCTDGVCTSESCAPNASSCYAGEACCTGLCTWDQQNPYLPGECFSPQPLGASCLEDAWCESGLCIEGACSAPNCAPQEGMCWSDDECCQGFCTFSAESLYNPGVCQPLQPLESLCEGDAWCESGSCIDGLCKPSGCQVFGGDCHAGSDCCSGLCTYSAQGEQCGTCIEEQAQGMPCVADMWCISQSCVDGLCAPAP
mgnify:CR=1 FL=1